MGKRNYAIILLAARLGLRASDIARLKFENLDWQTNQIRLRQIKTGKELILPEKIGFKLKYFPPHN